MREVVGNLPRKSVSFRHLGTEAKLEAKAVTRYCGSGLASALQEEQPTVEGTVSPGSKID